MGIPIDVPNGQAYEELFTYLRTSRSPFPPGDDEDRSRLGAGSMGQRGELRGSAEGSCRTMSKAAMVVPQVP